jgi:uncharacterized protein (TIGR00156 family)
MKKLLMLSVVLSMVAGSAMAQYVERGGFKDPATIVNTVSELKHMQDDSYVVLEGKIEKRLGKEEYLFSDASGSITIEIDDDEWRGVEVGPQDTVEIIGELDKGIFSDEIDVKQIRLLKK